MSFTDCNVFLTLLVPTIDASAITLTIQRLSDDRFAFVIGSDKIWFVFRWTITKSRRKEISNQCFLSLFFYFIFDCRTIKMRCRNQFRRRRNTFMIRQVSWYQINVLFFPDFSTAKSHWILFRFRLPLIISIWIYCVPFVVCALLYGCVCGFCPSQQIDIILRVKRTYFPLKFHG